MSDFGSTLIALRKNHNMTQRELAEALNVSKSTISMYENGTRKPSFEVLGVIADYFNVDMDVLVGRDSPKSKYEIQNENISVVTIRMMEDDDFYRAVELVLSMDPKELKAFIALFDKQ